MKSSPNAADQETYRRALQAYAQGDYARSEALLRPLAARMPRFAEAHHLLGICQYLRNNLAEAERAIRNALSVATHPDFYLNLGLVLQKAGNPDEAADAYRSSLALNPRSTKACNNLANILVERNRDREAVELYRQALLLQPGYAIGHKNLGASLKRLKLHTEAEAALRRAIALDNAYAEAKEQLAELLVETERFEEAFEIYRSIDAWAKLQFEMRMIASWNGLERVDQACLDQFGTGGARISAPWCLIQMPGITPAQQRRAGHDFAAKELAGLRAAPLCTSGNVAASSGQLRIGYLSSDFYDHATMHLLAGVLEAHDRARYEFSIFSYGPSRADAFSKRLRATGLPLIDLSAVSDQAAAQEILRREVDILVDLKGYTTSARLGITALRPAPIIVNWLGYPGTLGHERLADYIIGDPIVTPPEDAEHFTERLAQMPNCYQPNDRLRPLPDAPGRAKAGLPEKGLVFCSFNQAVKFNPQTFDIWGRLLEAVPDSVLWLLQPKASATRSNLTRELTGRGIDAKRIIFAPFASQAKHIARLRLCDLALDTFPYNSHTTGSDALWAGVPLVTLKGQTFASRVAASLLTAHGFPELVAENEDDYFKLAFGLATNPPELAALKDRLETARLRSPLFDTARFARDLEALYEAIRLDHNLPPDARSRVVSIAEGSRE